jgi:hypothetical protein
MSPRRPSSETPRPLWWGVQGQALLEIAQRSVLGML